MSFFLTEVQYAAHRRRADVCALLLQLGVDPNYEDLYGR